jgi:hypothetical protein
MYPHVSSSSALSPIPSCPFPVACLICGCAVYVICQTYSLRNCRSTASMSRPSCPWVSSATLSGTYNLAGRTCQLVLSAFLVGGSPAQPFQLRRNSAQPFQLRQSLAHPSQLSRSLLPSQLVEHGPRSHHSPLSYCHLSVMLKASWDPEFKGPWPGAAILYTGYVGPRGRKDSGHVGLAQRMDVLDAGLTRSSAGRHSKRSPHGGH